MNVRNFTLTFFLLIFADIAHSAIPGTRPIADPPQIPTSVATNQKSSTNTATPSAADTSCAQLSQMHEYSAWLEARKEYAKAAVSWERIAKCQQAGGALLARMESARMQVLAGQESNALNRLDSVIAITEPEEPIFAQAMTLRTVVLLRMQRFPEARDALRRARLYAGPEQGALLRIICRDLESKTAELPPLDCTSITAHKNTSLEKISSSLINQPAGATTTPAEVNVVGNRHVTSATTPSTTTGQWVLQLGAFGQRDNAELLVETLKARKITVRILTRSTEDRNLFLVQTDGFSSREAALEWAQINLEPLRLEFQPLPLQ